MASKLNVHDLSDLMHTALEDTLDLMGMDGKFTADELERFASGVANALFYNADVYEKED